MEYDYELMEQVLISSEKIEKNYMHTNWRVRYAAAVAMGETHDEKWLPHLFWMLKYENTLPLYTQPPVQGFENSYDDTRMAEQLVPIKEIFDKEYPEDLRECWRCCGRVKQACLFAIEQIGSATPQIIELLHTYLQKPGDDYSVKAASAMALGTVGHKGSIPYLEMGSKIDEWCVQCQCKKSIKKINEQ